MVFVIIHTPKPTSKGLDHPYFHVYVCLLLWFMLMLASLVLGFATLDAFRWFVVVWLHPTPTRPHLGVTTWDASPDVGSLCACPSLSRSMRWYAYHTCLCHPLAFFASLHACLHVHVWVLLASVSSTLQHNEVMDIRSKPTFVPRKHHLLSPFLFVYIFACLLAILLVCSHPCLYACHIYHAYLLYSSFICTSHLFLSLLVCWFLVFAFACTHMEQGRMELEHSFSGASKKGVGASMSIWAKYLCSIGLGV